MSFIMRSLRAGRGKSTNQPALLYFITPASQSEVEEASILCRPGLARCMRLQATCPCDAPWRGCAGRSSYGDGWTAAHDAADRASDHRHDDAAVRETRRDAGVSLARPQLRSEAGEQGRREGHGSDERQGCAANLRARHTPTISASMSRRPRSGPERDRRRMAGVPPPRRDVQPSRSRAGPRSAGRAVPNEGQAQCGRRPRGALAPPPTGGRPRCGQRPRGAWSGRPPPTGGVQDRGR